MTIEIIGNVDKTRLFCAGSVTKMLTTYVSLSKLSEKYNLNQILNDDHFLETISIGEKAQSFYQLFYRLIGKPFSLRDICSFYSGLPYTFDLSINELNEVEQGLPFKHHRVLTEEDFLSRCQNNLTPVYTSKCKFHYSEIAIIFLGFLIESIYSVKMEELYQQYLINKFSLKNSVFARKRPSTVYAEDLSDRYDYPAIAILDHGYFCYSNGFYSTLNDTKLLIESIIDEDVFQHMVDVTKARAASPRLMNGLTIELRKVSDDILFGYEGLSYSGCNIWAYSTKYKKGYLTFTDDEEAAYDIYQQFGYELFDKVPAHTQIIYQDFIKHYNFSEIEQKPIPIDYQGQYHRVKINDSELNLIFELGPHTMQIRNPEMLQYDVIYYKGNYRILGKDKVHGAKVGLYTAESGNKYFIFDGNLYRKL